MVKMSFKYLFEIHDFIVRHHTMFEGEPVKHGVASVHVRNKLVEMDMFFTNNPDCEWAEYVEFTAENFETGLPVIIRITRPEGPDEDQACVYEYEERFDWPDTAL